MQWVGEVLNWPEEQSVEIVVAPPFPYIGTVAKAAAKGTLLIAGQNLSEHAAGAYTGEVAAEMLQDTGCSDVIIGHSERRQIFGEDDETIARKLVTASSAGLRPILCVGETKEIRDAGKTVEHVDTQLKAALGTVSIAERLVIAYEPVWAIGTGDNATPLQIEQAHAAIRKILRDLGLDAVPILYGGSVKPANAAELASVGEVDGFLVGGASLSSGSFRDIRDAVASARGRY